MTPVKAVKEPETDPKQGKARAKSGVRFPYNDLAQSVQVAGVIHHKAGGLCDLAQLATLLGYSGVRNGAFRTQVSAARMFGLIEENDDQKLRVAPRGLAIIAPVSGGDAARAKVEAFMAVELFKKIFERFHGATLPEQVGLRNLLATEYQVVPDRVAPTVRIMLDSAAEAGLFNAAGNRTRMVLPLTLPGGTTQVTPPASTPRTDTPSVEREGKNGGGGGGGGGLDDEIDPAIRGLLRRFPPGGTPIASKRRKALIDAFTAIVGVVYPEADPDE